jgi:hypothetical protein
MSDTTSGSEAYIWVERQVSDRQRDRIRELEAEVERLRALYNGVPANRDLVVQTRRTALEQAIAICRVVHNECHESAKLIEGSPGREMAAGARSCETRIRRLVDMGNPDD